MCWANWKFAAKASRTELRPEPSPTTAHQGGIQYNQIHYLKQKLNTVQIKQSKVSATEPLQCPDYRPKLRNLSSQENVAHFQGEREATDANLEVTWMLEFSDKAF